MSDREARDIGLKAVTAARLSAAFPYVSPAARLDGVEPYHLVDGGYYDFYGLVALSQWVDDALEELQRDQQLPERIGVVIARGLVSSDTALSDDDARAAQPASAHDGCLADGDGSSPLRRRLLCMHRRSLNGRVACRPCGC